MMLLATIGGPAEPALLLRPIQIGEEGHLPQSARLGHDQPPAFGVIELEWEMGPPKLTTDVIAQHHPAVRGGYTISLVKARLVTF